MVSEPQDRGAMAFVRLIVALAFVVGSTAFVGLLVPIAVGVFADYVPVLPVAAVLVLALGFAGGIGAAIGAAKTWWSFGLGLVLGTGAGFVAAATAQLILLASFQGALTWGVRPFDAEQWREASTDTMGYNPRGKMIAALMVGGALDGKGAEDVAALLGPPDCGTTPDRGWQIGLWSGLQLRPDCLQVVYADDGLASAVVIQH